MKANIYIDGGNLYFGLLKGHPEMKWLDLIRQELRRQVVVLNPKDRRSDLIHHATIYRDIPRDLPAICQLPDEVPVGKNGKVIRRPAAWK